MTTTERPLRVILIAGSNRRQYNCPGVDSKSRALMLRMADRLPGHWDVDIEDLGNVYGRAANVTNRMLASRPLTNACSETLWRETPRSLPGRTLRRKHAASSMRP